MLLLLQKRLGQQELDDAQTEGRMTGLEKVKKLSNVLSILYSSTKRGDVRCDMFVVCFSYIIKADSNILIEDLID